MILKMNVSIFGGGGGWFGLWVDSGHGHGAFLDIYKIPHLGNKKTALNYELTPESWTVD